ncbi:MAG: RtcB family protein, partial [Actinomycetota bacterium]|nr:RtcB family protein [Actinomycetota bacterium]
GEGEGAEVVLYALGDLTANSAFKRVLPATRLPGVESPVYAAASPEGLGWVALSASHAAPDLASVPARGLLLVAEAALGDLGVPPEEVPLVFQRRLSEVRLPHLAAAGISRVCEAGARAAAESGLIEEEDLPLLDPRPGDADALGRRAISAGGREWDLLGDANACVVGEVLDSEAAEVLGLNGGALALVVSVGAGDLGRLAIAGHRERIAARVRGGDFGAEEDLPAAPTGTEEAADLLAAVDAAANFADGRAALLLYALRLALKEFAGELGMRAAWGIGGIEVRDGYLVHRSDLAVAGEGEVLVSGGSVAAGTGKASGSVPPFGAIEDDGRHPWEEAEVLERWADLDPLNGRS